MSETKRRGRPPKDGKAAISGNPKQFRLSEETLADLDYLMDRFGLTTRSDVIRFLARRGALDERRKEGK